MSHVPVQASPVSKRHLPGDTTRARVLSSGPLDEVQRLQLQHPAPGQPTRDRGRRRTVADARAAAEVSWAVAAMLRRAIGADAGAWVSTTLRVVDSGFAWRPDVAVALDPLPVDGRGVPALVVEVDAQRPVRPAEAWLGCGAAEVWHLGRGAISVVTGPARSSTRRDVATGVLAVPLVEAGVEVVRLCSLAR